MSLSDVLPGFDSPPQPADAAPEPKPVRIQQRLIDAARIDSAGAGKWWKCGTPDPRSKNRRGDGRDMTKRWPACIAFQPKDGVTE